jgi:hypothetical protein
MEQLLTMRVKHRLIMKQKTSNRENKHRTAGKHNGRPVARTAINNLRTSVEAYL